METFAYHREATKLSITKPNIGFPAGALALCAAAVCFIFFTILSFVCLAYFYVT